MILCVFFLPYVILAVATTALNPMVLKGCRGCFGDDTNSTLQIVFAVFALVGLLLSVYAVRNLPDKFEIVREIKRAALVGGLPALVCDVLDVFANVYPDFGYTFHWQPLIEIFLVIYSTIVSLVPAVRALRFEVEGRRGDVS